MLRSSKNADQRKQWWYRVVGYSAVTPLPGNYKKHSIQKSLILESNFLALLQVGLSTTLAEVQEENYFPVRKFSIKKETYLSHTCTNPCNLVI